MITSLVVCLDWFHSSELLCGVFQTPNNFIVQYDIMADAHNNVITHCDIIIGIPSNVIMS